LAEHWQVKSISLPALGTGVCKHTAASFISALKHEIQALEGKQHYLQSVTVCELDQKAFKDVSTEWKESERIAPKEPFKFSKLEAPIEAQFTYKGLF
jgi:O-acetyl-ADP-ribose deacetylase (regulator of RNase III)